MKNFFLSLLLAFSLTLLPSIVVFAGPEGISKQQAVSIAQQVYPGRVLAVKREDSVYRVKTLNDNGEVRIILIDANSGKVISDE